MSERDKYLTEAMGGTYFNGSSKMIYRPDFSTWHDFGNLWEWAQKQYWWKDFIENLNITFIYTLIPTQFIHPSRFADAVYEYLKGGL